MLRATFKSLLSRKLRMLLAVTAVVLGTAFVSASFVVTDTLGARFDRLFQTLNADVAVQVQPTEKAAADLENPPLLTEAQLAALRKVPGAARVAGDVEGAGVLPLRRSDGKAVVSQSAPAFAVGLSGDDPFSLVKLAEGSLPRGAGEVAVSRLTARKAGVRIGDPLKLYLPSEYGTREYRVSGLLEYTNGRESLAGETLVAFPLAEAQKLFFGKEGVYSGAKLSAAGGISQKELRQRAAAAVPGTFEAHTAAEVNRKQAGEVKESLKFITWFFLAFAGVSVFVGIFLIFNTFNILIAQRARELALFRALGAGWRQVAGSVLAEALVVGVVGSTLGLLAGLGLAVAGQVALSRLLQLQLPEAPLAVSPLAVAVTYLVGVLVTVLSALVPAVKASRVPPVAAMRDVARPDRSLRGLTVTGLLLVAPGVAAIGWALTGIGSATLPVLGLGVALAFLGVALLSPLLARPIAGAIGAALAWGMAGRLGHRNAQRNPRRTAVTAATLMIGVTLVSTVSLLGASFKADTEKLTNKVLGADVIVGTQTQNRPNGQEGYDPKRLDRVREVPGVTRAVALHTSTATVDGRADEFVSATDLAVAKGVLAMSAKGGELRTLADGEAVVDAKSAAGRSWSVGGTVRVRLDRGGERTYRIVGIYESKVPGVSGVVLGTPAVARFGGPLASQGYVTLARGTDAKRAVRDVERILADYPLVTVYDRSDYTREQTRVLDTVLTLFRVLLALAILIAVLGIVNTMLLSIFERTRELGMLRAVGMDRRGLRRMIRVESTVIALFGAVLGIGLGVGLGTAVAQALKAQKQLSTVAIPWLDLGVISAGALVVGVLAAVWPAYRAARLNVLAAIAHE
jgi:putative ABC transport system permease protein